MPSAFVSYSHHDEDLRDLFEIHLAMLKREGKLTTWHDRRMTLSSGIDETISEYLLAADVIFALISPQFLASAYCYEKELVTALERHQNGSARLVCVILRPCDWKSAPFATNLVAPKDGKPVTKWASLDDGFLDVVQQTRLLLEELHSDGEAPASMTLGGRAPVAISRGVRSSNLRIKNEFTQVQRDRFIDDAFDYIKAYFENSLSELQERNPGIEYRFKPTSSGFTAQIYKNGKDVSHCRIYLESMHHSSPEILYSSDLSTVGGSYHESLRSGFDDTRMFLEASGFSRRATEKLTFEGGAEQFWTMLISNLR